MQVNPLSTASDGAPAPSAPPASTDRRLLAIFLIVLIDVLGLTIILPLLPFYSEHFGASPLTIGALVSTYALCQLISGPILGHWSDRIGRKPVLIVSQIGTCIGFLVLASAHSLSWIFVSRIIDGATAGNLSTAQAYISDVAAPQDRAKQLGRIGIAFSVGFFVGPTITAFLYHFGYHAPILAAAGLSALSILASTLLLPSEKKTREAQEAHKATEKPLLATALGYFKDPQLSRFLFQIFLFYFSFSSYMSGFALFAERRFTFHGIPVNPRQVGYAFAYFGLLGILIQGFVIGRLVKLLGERRVVRFGFLASLIGYGVLGFIHEPLWIGITGLFLGFGGSVLRPVLISEITGAVNPKERGRVIGVTQSIQSVAQIIAPLVGTALIGRALLTQWALLPSLLCGLGFLLVTFQAMQTKNREQTPDAS